MSDTKRKGRIKRHRRIRLKVKGTKNQPRLCVFRSLKNIFTQIIDDEAGKTLLSVSSLSKELKKEIKYGGNIKSAVAVGKLLAEKSQVKKIKKVVLDRAGYAYHGRIKALSEAAKGGGLEF